MRLSRGRGRLRLRLDAVEVELLRSLLDDLEQVLADVEGDEAVADSDDAVVRRLFPAAYPDDAEAAQEFRGLTETALRSERTQRIEACRADLAGGDVDLSGPDDARRWIQVLNDLRLTSGTRLGVTEDDDLDIDVAGPTDPDRVVYYWLTQVQDAVVRALRP